MGMPEGTPDITEVIVVLKEDGDATHMTMVQQGAPAGSPGEGVGRKRLTKWPPNSRKQRDGGWGVWTL